MSQVISAVRRDDGQIVLQFGEFASGGEHYTFLMGQHAAREIRQEITRALLGDRLLRLGVFLAIAGIAFIAARIWVSSMMVPSHGMMCYSHTANGANGITGVLPGDVLTAAGMLLILTRR